MSTPGDGWMKITAIVPVSVLPVWEAVVDQLRAEGVDHATEVVRNGFVIEVLCAEYLANPGR